MSATIPKISSTYLQQLGIISWNRYCRLALKQAFLNERTSNI